MRIDGNKWIFFEKCGDKPKTEVYAVVNKSSDNEIGQIEWYYPWRQYIFAPVEASVYNDGCLDTITAFLKRLNKEKKLSNSTKGGENAKK